MGSLFNVLKLLTVIHDNYRMITFNIKDLYVNVPIEETLNTIKTKLQQNNDTQTTHQIISLLKNVLSQNYFTFQQKIYQPAQGMDFKKAYDSVRREVLYSILIELDIVTG